MNVKATRKRRQPRPQRPARTCLFCGAAGPLTGEHIYGDWLRKLGFDGEGVRELVPGDGSAPIIQKGGPFSKKLPVVCSSCNSGWMSGLETAAKPLFISLFSAGGQSVALDEDAQIVLARWAFKTAAVAAQVAGTDPFPVAHRVEFYNDDRPPRQATVRIGVASIPSTPEHGLQLAEYGFEPRTATVKQGPNATSFPFYRATFRLLSVVFDVLGYVADDGVELDIEPNEDLARALLPIWPTTHPKLWWPPTRSLDEGGGAAGLINSQIIGVPTLIPPPVTPGSPGQTIEPGDPSQAQLEDGVAE